MYKMYGTKLLRVKRFVLYKTVLQVLFSSVVYTVLGTIVITRKYFTITDK